MQPRAPPAGHATCCPLGVVGAVGDAAEHRSRRRAAAAPIPQRPLLGRLLAELDPVLGAVTPAMAPIRTRSPVALVRDRMYGSAAYRACRGACAGKARPGDGRTAGLC